MGWLSMWVSDPSEAAESAAITATLRRYFTVVETKEYGGTILQLLLKEIAHNFIKGDEMEKRLLDTIFEIEDCLLASGEIESDYAFFVCMDG